jgi:hypothetical protein
MNVDLATRGKYQKSGIRAEQERPRRPGLSVSFTLLPTRCVSLKR